MTSAHLPPLLAEPLDHCEDCNRPLYAGDMAFTYDDGPTFCWEHAPTWNDLKAEQDELIAAGLWVEMHETPEDAEGNRKRVLARIANGEGDRRVAYPL